MVGWSPQWYIPSFVEIVQPILGIKVFKGFYHIGAWRPPWSCGHQIFISLYLKAFLQSSVQIDTVVSEKIKFECLYVHDLGPMSRNDIDIQYSHIFIYLIRCLLRLTSRSLAAIVSEKSTVLTFSYRKA